MDAFKPERKMTDAELQKLIDEALAGIPQQRPALLMVEVREGHLSKSANGH